MSDQTEQEQASGPTLSLDEVEQLRGREGLTAAELDQLRRDNQPSKIREAEKADENEGETDD